MSDEVLNFLANVPQAYWEDEENYPTFKFTETSCKLINGVVFCQTEHVERCPVSWVIINSKIDTNSEKFPVKSVFKTKEERDIAYYWCMTKPDVSYKEELTFVNRARLYPQYALPGYLEFAERMYAYKTRVKKLMHTDPEVCKKYYKYKKEILGEY